MPGLDKGFPKAVYGVPVRDVLDPGEDDFFRKHPDTAGMAADDDHIILNPYSPRTAEEKALVAVNEAARVLMSKNAVPRPTYELTPEQQEKFKDYSANPDDIRQTIAGRILSNDPSAINPTDEQRAYVDMLRKFMGVTAGGR